MKSIITHSLYILALCLSLSANAALIDFEDGMPGDIITNSTIDGATFSVTGQGNTSGNPRELILFNSDCTQNVDCTGGDNDLSFPGAGNILIISQDNNFNNPNDSASGGDIAIDFGINITSISLVTLDVGDSRGRNDGDNFLAAFFQGSEVARFDFLGDQGENNVQTAFLSGLFDSVVLHLEGSGGLVSVDFTAVPVPAALPLFITGLIGLFGLRKKALLK
ncbi:MAG: VPLPA-CTERM sorting domain-containing protein [Gammaproteobacteria bacterium]|nr:VPLPA-CTERM sorting domain-containing protein [Gammaproteobacteria bacterium]